MITASQAKDQTIQVIKINQFEESRLRVLKQKYSNLFGNIDSRISSSIMHGLFEASLQSIGDDGFIIKTSGYFLSDEAFETIKLIYSQAGYTFKETLDCGDVKKFICWA